MRHLGLATISIILFFGSSSFATEPNKKVCSEGKTTKLLLSKNQPMFLRHDQSIGKADFELVDKTGIKVSTQFTLEGSWECIGFNAQKSVHVLTGRWEDGTVLALRGLRLLTESPTAQPKIAQFELSHRSAIAWKWSKDYRWMAFIDPNGKLSVYDLLTDSVRDLARAPSPPPLSKEDQEALKEMGLKWNWMTYAEQKRGELEDWLFGFSDAATLHASFGQDSMNARSKKRKIKTWNLQGQSK